jgi:hypothetical protein
MSERKPHKHAEVIKAFADGYPIQYKAPNWFGWRDWKAVNSRSPTFNPQFCYRVKPEPKKLYIQTMKDRTGMSWDVTYRSSEIMKQQVERYLIYGWKTVGPVIIVELHDDA